VAPLISWSRYLGPLRAYFDAHLRPGWADSVSALAQLVHQGDGIYQMMHLGGEEGITIDLKTPGRKPAPTAGARVGGAQT
jgi:V/A-type H+-transporting ATPase subunit A